MFVLTTILLEGSGVIIAALMAISLLKKEKNRNNAFRYVKIKKHYNRNHSNRHFNNNWSEK